MSWAGSFWQPLFAPLLALLLKPCRHANCALSVLWWLLVVAFVAVILGHAGPKLNTSLADYAPVEKTQTLTLQQLEETNASNLPLRRIALAGRRKDPFSAIWVGDIVRLKSALATANWQEKASWSWSDGISYTNTHFNLPDLAPQPLLHEGEAAVLTAVLEDSKIPGTRMVFRAYKSHALI